MPVYKSEDDTNRKLVSCLYFDEDRQLKDPALNTFLDDAYKAHREILELLEDPYARLEILEHVLDRDYSLAIWKTLSQRSEWHRFISHLDAKAVPTRTIGKIKQIVEEAFLVLLEDAKEMQEKEVYVITGVKDVQIKQGSNGITVYIKYL